MVAAIPKEQLAAMPYLTSVQINPFVLAFRSFVVLMTGILFGLIPAIQTSRTDANLTLKDEGRMNQGHGTSRLRDALVAQLSPGLAHAVMLG